MAITSKGITYPTSSDNIAPLETHFTNLANRADNIGVIAGSYLFTGPASTGATVDVTVPFGLTLTGTPMVTATVQGSAAVSSYAVTIVNAPSTTGFVAKVYKLSGASVESNLQLVWMASTYAAI